MRERTYIAALISLDLMLIATGAAMAWVRAVPVLSGRPGSTGMAVLSAGLIAIVGGYILYETNAFAFRIAEIQSADRNSRLAAWAFAGATVAGCISGLTL